MERLNLENREPVDDFQEKHNYWLTEARVIVESIGFHVGVGLVSYGILKAIWPQIDIPPAFIMAMPTAPTMDFMFNRSKKLHGN